MRIVAPDPHAATRDIVADAAFRRLIKQRLAASGLSVMDIEAFWIGPGFDPNAMAAFFDPDSALRITVSSHA